MFKRKKTNVVPEQSVELVVTKLAEIFGSSLKTVVQFGNESSLLELTKLPPAFFILVSEIDTEQFESLGELFETSGLSTPFVALRHELPQLSKRFPLELIHIRSDYSLSYGEDVINPLEISREDVREQLIRELTSSILQLRSSLINQSDDSNSVGIRILRRLIPICKGLLSFRDLTIPVSWGSLVSELESSYNVTRFPLSEMIAALEQNETASLNKYFTPLLTILEELRDLLVEGENV